MTNTQPRPNGAQQITATTWADLMARTISEPADLLGGWLHAGETAMVWAQPGVGKSMLALTVALTVAGGGSFLGLFAPEPRRVLFVDGEMTAYRVKQRLQTLAEGIEGLDREAAGGNLMWLARKDQQPGTVFPDIATEEGRKALLKQADAHRPALVVLDNFQSLASVEDENVTTAFNEVEHLMMELQRRGTATLLVHHAAKHGGTYRGTSKIGGVFDSVVGLKRLEDVPAGQAGFAFHVEKDRNGSADGGPLPHAAKLEGGRWVAVEDEQGTVDRVVKALRSLGFTSQRAIARHLGVNASTVNKALARAEAHRKLNKGEAGRLFAEAKRLAGAGFEPDAANDDEPATSDDAVGF